MTDKLESLLRKIRALRAKAEGTNNVHEAAAFAAKAAQMLAEHGLEEAQLRSPEADPTEGVTMEKASKSWSASPARRQMLLTLCQVHGVRVLWFAGKSGPWMLIGRKSTIAVTLEMADYLLKATARLASEWQRAHDAPNKLMVDFKRGCFVTLQSRLFDLEREQHAQPEQRAADGTPRNLPAVVADDRSAVEAFLAKHFGEVKAARRDRVVLRSHAADAGREAGRRISLRKQIGG